MLHLPELHLPDRRRALFIVALPLAAALTGLARDASPALASGGPHVLVHKDPNCGCCGAWAERLRAAGFAPEVVESRDLSAVRARLGVPEALTSCHTAEVEGYAVEGHVPPAALRRLLSERPAARGLAVPGMPLGSPGMEVAGAPSEVYEVVLFGQGNSRSFGRYRGNDAIGG